MKLSKEPSKSEDYVVHEHFSSVYTFKLHAAPATNTFCHNISAFIHTHLIHTLGRTNCFIGITRTTNNITTGVVSIINNHITVITNTNILSRDLTPPGQHASNIYKIITRTIFRSKFVNHDLNTTQSFSHTHTTICTL
ncbi:hypothetical protein ACOMHN_036180 [Nucella lapillus]